MPDYSELIGLSEKEQGKLKDIFEVNLAGIKNLSYKKVLHYVGSMSDICRMHHNSIENRKQKLKHANKHHPLKPQRGEIYNAILTEGVGSELSGNHLVIIIQNAKGNIYGEKVNIVPIEGDGNSINANYQEQLRSTDLDPDEDGKPVILHKDPSRIILTDILTIDKARLQRRIGKIKKEKMATISRKLVQQLELF